MRGGPVYIVKPKYIFKHPFNKYDLSNPTNRETQNEQLTDYFNYGFNEDTMNIYGKLVKRMIEVLDHHKNLEYFNQPSQLMRLNDEIPMDFGGFNKFHDPWIVDNETSQNFHDGQNLMKYFVMMIFANVSSKKVQYPLIQFISQMYREDEDNQLYTIIDQIGKNLEAKYQETMKKLQEKANQKHPVKAQEHKKQSFRDRDNNRDRGDRGDRGDRDRGDRRDKDRGDKDRADKDRGDKDKDRDRGDKDDDRHRKQKTEKSPKRRSPESSSDSSSDSESRPKRSRGENGSKNKKKEKERRRSRERSRDKDHKKRDRSDKKDKRDDRSHKSKKVKKEKEKDRKRSRSRDDKKKRRH